MANDDRLKAAFKRTRKGVGAAFNRIRSATGQGPDKDPDVELYKTLTPAHFRVLTAKYGKQNMDRYIATMERKING